MWECEFVFLLLLSFLLSLENQYMVRTGYIGFDSLILFVIFFYHDQNCVFLMQIVSKAIFPWNVKQSSDKSRNNSEFSYSFLSLSLSLFCLFSFFGQFICLSMCFQFQTILWFRVAHMRWKAEVILVTKLPHYLPLLLSCSNVDRWLFLLIFSPSFNVDHIHLDFVIIVTLSCKTNLKHLNGSPILY